MAYIGNQPLATAVTNADISSSAAIDLSKLATSGDLSATNVTLGGYLRGPSTFTIDPATHGDNTGTLVIAGNLQVDGTTTTVNSTTMEVDDLNITVASGAANAAAADGAGITVDGASATLLYNATPDAWSFNKSLGIGTTTPDSNTKIHIVDANNAVLRIEATGTNKYPGINLINDAQRYDFQIDGATDALRIRDATNSVDRMVITSGGNLLVGVTSSSANMAGTELASNGQLYASTSSSSGHFFNRQSTDGDIVTFRKDGTTVGKIGNVTATPYFSNATTGGIRLGTSSGSTIVNPCSDTGAVENNLHDLGSASSAWRKLYLGGGVVDNTTTVSYASSIALSYTNGAIQTVTLTGNVTFTDSLNDGEAIVLMLNGGASHTVTWTAVTKWVTGSGNAAPTLTASDAIILWKIGSSVYAATAGSFA